MSRGRGSCFWSGGLLAVTLSYGCSGQPRAPEESGVCWRADVQPRGTPAFMVVAADSPDLLSCAADLELAYLGEGRPLIGAFQGRWIFIGPGAIESAERLGFLRYPMFNAAQRADLDRKLRAFLAARAGPPKVSRHE